MLLANNCCKLNKSTKNIEENEDTEGNEQGRNDELRTGSDEVLPSEGSVSAGGIGETESNGGSEADVDSDSENGAVSESASGEQVEETTKSEQVHKKVAEGTNGERISKLPKAERAKAQRAALEELGIFAEVALPKGSKWSDGRKFGQKATRRSASTQITALVVGEDLYIKGIGLPWTNINNKNNDVYVIRNFRKWQSIGDFQMALLDHADITLTPSEEDAVNTIFTENGIGFNRSITRPIEFQQSAEALENNTPAQQLATEAAVAMLENNGIEVVEATDEMVEVVLGQSEAEFMSKRSNERAEINRTIDDAISFVTGKPIKEVRQERIRKERERKELAKEIYENALSGNFNDVILQKINQFIDDATPANPFGRRISQRIPHEMERGLLEGARTNAVDALFSRISESSVGANERFSESGRRAIESRKKEMLKAWAIATGNWYTDLSAFTDEAEPFAEGTDSRVYLSKDGQYVIKASKGKPYGKRFRPDIDNIVLFNNVFRNSRYEIVGYGEIDGQFVRILKQPIVDFSNSTPLTEDERVEYMGSLGFRPINKENTAFSNGEIVAADLQKNNIVRDKAGNISVIDADMKLHTKDVGGDYEYLPVEYDLPSPQFHIVYHGTGTKFDAFDHSHMGEGEGAQAYGWGTYVTEVEDIGKDYAKVIRDKNTSEKHRENAIINKLAKELLVSKNGNKEDALAYLHELLNESWSDKKRVKAQIRIIERGKFLPETKDKAHLYTVEIPDDNGSNYLSWVDIIDGEIQERVANGLQNIGFEIEPNMNHLALSRNEKIAVLNINAKGKDLYAELSDALGSDKAASEFLNSIGFVGIKYPAQYTMGGRSDNAKNYVIFNENDAKIVDRVEFMRTPNGTVYGWTIGGKVYLTKSGMNPNTPVHEYTHLWANAMMQKNPKGWQSIKDLLRGTPVWNEVMLDKNYANIHDNEDLVASEVLSRLSGKENAKKLEAMAEEMLKESKGIFAKAEAISLIERMKEALNKFWNWVGTNLFGIDKFDSIEQVTDRVLWDMATGTDLSDVEYSDIVEAHYWSDKTAEKAVAAFKEHYPNAGEIVIFNSPNELYDFGRRLGEPEEDINDYLKRVEDKEVAASYSPDLDKMLIFAWQHANHYQSLLHEYIHRAIDNLGGIKRFRVLVAFLRSVDRDLVKKLFKYYQPDQIDDELIAYTLQYAFTGNAIEDLKSILSDYAIEQLNEILNYIGYETGRDTATEIERFERHSSSEIFKDEQGRIRRNVFSYVFRPHSTGRFTQSYKKELEEAASRTRSEEGADRELEDLYRNSEEDQAYAERMRGYMRDKVNELAERMNLKIEVVEDASTLKGKKAKAKGFFNPRTGTITVVLPNNSSIADVEQTVFHEAVAHYGLRQLFGDKFDKFLDEVYEFAEPEIRERIARMALRGGLDIRKATEEYLATLAEDTEYFENNPAQWEWFAKIKRAFIKMLRTVGLNYMVPRMSDNELRYFLWLSYENLRGKVMPIFKEAAQIAKQQELGLDNYGQSIDKTDSVADSEEVLYRKGETPREKYERVTRRPTINNDVKLYHNLWNRFVEAYQDKMQSLSALQNAVAEESGKPIKPHEDAYSAENRMSSENKAQAEIYKRDFLGPLMNVITSLIKNKKVTYQDIKDYLIAKHGLERNDHMAMRDAKQQALKDLGPEPERPTSYLDADYDAKQQAWEDWNIAYTEAVKTNYEANRQRDYSGLLELTESENVAEAEENCTKNGFITIICLYKFESYTNITS